MLRSTFARVVPYLIVMAPMVAACGSVNHEVGSDDSGAPECTTRAGVVCHSPNVPEGCSLSEATCSDGVIHCGQVICPATNDGGSCSGESVCVGPNVPVGCTLGPDTCVGGSIHCGEVTCPESADAGTDAGNCEGQAPPPCVAPTPGCTWEGPECVDGHLGCGTLVCADAGPGAGNDASTSFACGKATCNAATEYCDVEAACIEALDGGNNASVTCQPIPAGCTAGANTCQCILNATDPSSNSVESAGPGCVLTNNCV